MHSVCVTLIVVCAALKAPFEGDAPQDMRPLYVQLSEQKAKKQEAFEEQFKFGANNKMWQAAVLC